MKSNNLQETSIPLNESPKTFNKHYDDLKDNRWINKRKKVKDKVKNKCSNCGFEGVLDVHHLYYIKGKHLWEYPYKALVALCRGCHTKWHEEHNLEYRAEIYSENKEYQSPKKQKTYFVTKGKKSVKKLVPYTKPKLKKTGTAQQPLTPLQKAKKRINKRVSKEGKFSWSPIPKWRQEVKKQQNECI